MLAISPQKVDFKFSGHETFPLRYAWLLKGIQQLQKSKDIFNREDGYLELGVGKNMAKSIKFWCEAMGLIQPIEKSGHYKVSKLGQAIFSESGWDPYLEDPGTLWLLHWLLVSRINRVSTWHLTFTQWNKYIFTKDELAYWLYKTAKDAGNIRISIPVIKRDIDVFIRMYIPSKGSSHVSPEDDFDSPLVDLGLIEQIDKDHYKFNRGEKHSLPHEIVAYSLLQYWEQYYPNQSTIYFERLMHSVNSIGGTYKFTENALAHRLENLPKWVGITLNVTSGMRTIIRDNKVNNITPYECLKRYYQNENNTGSQK